MSEYCAAQAKRYSASSMSSLSSSTRASIASSFDSGSSHESFFVYCVYDFEAGDADQLSFKSNEILEIVKQEDSGWWAAVRDSDFTVGWIPSAFVEPISEEDVFVHRQRFSSPEEYSYDHAHDQMIEQATGYPLYVASQKEAGWTPTLSSRGVKPLPPIPDNTDSFQDALSPMSGAFSPDVAPESLSPGQEILVSPTRALLKRAYPPSPSTPMPQPPPPPKSAPLSAAVASSQDVRPRANMKRSLSCPTPAVPMLLPSPVQDPNNSSRSAPNRRRPVLIEDSTYLKRLSVLLETHGAEEADNYIHSPDMADAASFPARVHSRSSSEKVKQITGDQLAEALHAAKIAEAACPWFLRPIYDKDQIRLEYDGNIVGGTLPAIVERLTLDPLTSALLDFKLRHTFLTTFRTFAPASDIFDLLLERFDLDVPQLKTDAEVEEWRTSRLLPTQRRVLAIFKTWLQEHEMIEDDPPIAHRLQDFLSEVLARKSGNETLAALAGEVMKTLERRTFAVPETQSPALSLKKRKKSKDSKNDFLRLDPGVLAEHLCLHEHKYYAKVRPQECLDWAKTRNNQNVGNLLAFCALHDKLAGWVKQSVLWTENLGRRADTVDLWIKVAEKCRALHNYSSMSAIVTALSSTVIAKLYLTWAYVGPARRASHLEPLIKLNDPSGGFLTFRQMQQALDSKTPCVPFVGMYLTDILHINDHYTDTEVATSPGGPTERFFSFVKRRKWTDVLDVMLAFQKSAYPFAQDPALVQLIETNLAAATENLKDPTMYWGKYREVLQSEVESADIRQSLKDAGF